GVAVRARACSLGRRTPDVQLALLKRSIANVIDEIRGEIPLSRVTHMVVIGGAVRFPASQILESETGDGVGAVSRDAFLAFCDSVERLDEEQLIDRFRL